MFRCAMSCQCGGGFARPFLQGFAIGRDRLVQPRRAALALAEPRQRIAESWQYSARNTMLGIVCLDARVVLNPLIMLDQLGRDAIGQVGRYMIECSGPKMPDPHEDLEIRDRQAVGGAVSASMCFEPLL